MKTRPPFELRGIMLFYNTIMVFSNAFTFIKMLQFSKYGLEFLNMEYPSDKIFSSYKAHYLNICYFYLLTKFLDLFDTIFFVLRKKYNQISTLHLYHHTIVPIFVWYVLWLTIDLSGLMLFGLLNSLVHVIMYSYYSLSAFGPKIEKYLWWKRYITQLQLIQFVIFGIYAVLQYIYSVGYPKQLFIVFLPQPFIFFYMFYMFYRQSYKKKVH